MIKYSQSRTACKAAVHAGSASAEVARAAGADAKWRRRHVRELLPPLPSTACTLPPLRVGILADELSKDGFYILAKISQ